MPQASDLRSAFYPKAVAVVGVAAGARRDGPWAPGGANFIRAYEQLNFGGHIYPVNPRATEIMGYKAYPNVSSIPEPVDFVIVSVPAPLVFDVLEDCIKANAKNVHIFTSGFDETGEEEGREFGRRLREVAQRGWLRIIGPNCMGLYVPEAGIGCFDRLPKKSGPVSFIAQSGGHCNWFGHNAPNYGIYFNKVVSFGNASVLDSTDFLEYLAVDPETKIICMYLEGVKDGRRLFREVRNVNRVKPVILWKSGLTVHGSRAVASHTASLAGEEAIWKGFFDQTGAVPVTSLEEMAETTMSFLYLKPPKGKRVAVIGAGGGTSVAAADVCSREGLDLPALSQSTQNELKKLISWAGTSIRNPLDTGMVFRDVPIMAKEVELVAADPNIDMLILMPHLDMARLIGVQHVDEMIRYLSDFTAAGRSEKPVAVVFHSFMNDPWESEHRPKFMVELTNKGVPVYKTLAGASRALARRYDYSRILKTVKGDG